MASHPQGILLRSPPLGWGSGGSWTLGGRGAQHWRWSSRGTKGVVSPGSQKGPLASSLLGLTGSKAGSSKRAAGHLRKNSSGVAKGRPTLRANCGVKQRSGEFSGAVRVGVTWIGQGTDTRLTRRSAQEKSFFFLPGAQLAGRPAASVRGQPCPTLSSERVPEPPEACASYLPRRHCPRWRWGCPRWPAKRGSEKSHHMGQQRGIAAECLTCSPSGLQRAHIHPIAAQTPCSSNLWP